ncbi:hypothetical protein PF010_g1613 [Phytophthora fragariae]|uniref:Uncharacterized protein n=1 Tax=Phytophthora fragariae TaxID=53985 RepID=A0A6A3LNI6_9STRA|nr:hypothetical protein PF011_g5107 [Phytophthora fragariae]KAE9136611.1 hypothetical protein PF010_g1613 [Phytophthora fragariae]KAE9245779.1 hypothetical protein PF004_g5086 [Phytophthora fragariae]KAE9248117.1 hypothetical protein PF002_g5939 [Phytophthora fragariae]
MLLCFVTTFGVVRAGSGLLNLIGLLINACVQAVDKANKKFAIKITKCCLEHKHNLSEYVFKGHSSKRMSLDETTLKTVDELRKAGAKKSSVLKFIADNSQVPGCAQPGAETEESRQWEWAQY